MVHYSFCNNPDNQFFHKAGTPPKSSITHKRDNVKPFLPCSDYSDIRDAEPTNFSRAEQKEVYEQIAQLAHINFAKGKLTEDQRSLFKDSWTN